MYWAPRRKNPRKSTPAGVDFRMYENWSAGVDFVHWPVGVEKKKSAPAGAEELTMDMLSIILSINSTFLKKEHKTTFFEKKA